MFSELKHKEAAAFNSGKATLFGAPLFVKSHMGSHVRVQSKCASFPKDRNAIAYIDLAAPISKFLTRKRPRAGERSNCRNQFFGFNGLVHESIHREPGFVAIPV